MDPLHIPSARKTMKTLSADTAWNLGGIWRRVAVNAIRTNPLVLIWMIIPLTAFALVARIC